MASCEPLNTRNPLGPIVTKENAHELSVSTHERTHGTTVTVFCQYGYRLRGDNTFSCRGGSWDFNSRPYCELETAVKEEVALDPKVLLIISVVVVAVVVLLLGLMFAAVCYRYNKSRRKSESQDTEDRFRSPQFVAPPGAVLPAYNVDDMGVSRGRPLPPEVDDQETSFSERRQHSRSSSSERRHRRYEEAPPVVPVPVYPGYYDSDYYMPVSPMAQPYGYHQWGSGSSLGDRPGMLPYARDQHLWRPSYEGYPY